MSGLFGGGGSKSSSSTTNTDKRLAVGDGGIGVTADDSSVAINITDGGIVSRALDSIDLNNATLADGYGALIDAGEELLKANFDAGQNLIGTTQKHVADAYGQAQANANGTIDNRTLMVLAVAGAVALYALKK